MLWRVYSCCFAPDYDWDQPVFEKIYGYIDFILDKNDNVTRINMIRTNDKYRRLGIAAELVHRMALNHKTKLESTLSTEDGAGLVDFLQQHGLLSNG